jgi:hypothetical protein
MILVICCNNALKDMMDIYPWRCTLGKLETNETNLLFESNDNLQHKYQIRNAPSDDNWKLAQPCPRWKMEGGQGLLQHSPLRLWSMPVREEAHSNH